MQYALLHDGPRFKLESWGNGLSYDLTHKSSNTGTFVQGDDASEFEDKREEIERHMPDKTDDEVCAWLWDQCEYGMLATSRDLK